MADQLFDKYSDLPALTKETDTIIAQFKRVETGVLNLSKLGFKIDSSKTIAETAKANAELEKIQNQFVLTQKKLDAAVEKSRLISAQAGKAEAQQKLSELKLSEAKEKAILREIAAQEKLNKAKSKVAPLENVDNNAQIKAQALREQAKAEQELAEAQAHRLRMEEEILSNSERGQGASRTTLKKDDPITPEEVRAVTQYKDELEQLTGTLDENQDLQRTFKKEIKEYGDEIARLEKTTSKAEKGTIAYKDKVNALSTAQTDLKRQSQDLGTTIKRQVQEQSAAVGSLDQLRARLELAKTAYDNMSKVDRNSPIGQNLLATIKKLTPEVSALEQQTGRFQRQVGNYSKGVVNVFSKAYSGLRTLANIIPGLGIGGLIGAIVTGIVAIVSSFDLFGEKAAKVQNAIRDATREANEQIGKQVGELQALYKITQDSNQQLDDRKDATTRLLAINKDNNKATGETTQLLVDQNGVLLENKSGIDALTTSLVRQAKTRAFLNLIEKAYTDVIQKQNEEASKSTNFLEDILNFARINPLNPTAAVGNIFIGQAAAKEKGIKDAEAYLKQLQDKLGEGLASGELDLGGQFKETEDKGAKARQEKLRKDALELFKYRMQLLIEEQKAIVALEGGTPIRIRARERQAQLEKQLIAGVANFDMMQAEITEDAKKVIREKALRDIDKSQVDKESQQIAIRLGVEQKIAAEIEKLNAENYEKDRLLQEKLKQDRIAGLASTYEFQVRQSQNAIQAEIEQQRDLLAAGKITRQQYEVAKLRIQTAGNRASVEAEIKYYSDLLLIADLSTDKQAEGIKKLHELNLKLREIDLKDFDEKEKIKDELLKQRNAAVKALGEEVRDAASNILQGVQDAEKNRIQDQIDKIEELKAADIARITASADSEERKAARIKIVEAKAQSDREALERRQREIDRRKALFDRAFRVFTITAEGIENVAKIKASVLALRAAAALNPLLLPLVPLAASQIPLSLASTAASLIGILATPLPKFAVGTENAPGGHALVAEAGPELAVDPSGKITYYKEPTIANLTKGTIVKTASVTRDIIAQRKDLLGRQVSESAGSSDGYGEEAVRELKKLNDKKPIVVLSQFGIESTLWYKNQMKN